MAGYAIQGYSAKRDENGAPYRGRFFAEFNSTLARQFYAAAAEWEARRSSDLAGCWPVSEVPFGFMTHMNNGGIPNHGFTHWWTMFNPRQLLINAQLLRSILTVGNHAWDIREFVLAAYQQYLRNQNGFCIWDLGYDKLVPHMSNNNYHPKSNIIENCVFADLGRGNWASCVANLIEGREWAEQPWEAVSAERLEQAGPEILKYIAGKSEKVYPADPVGEATVFQCSSTDLSQLENSSVDLVITDPPFGGLLHYSELADFFYVWLRLALKEPYPTYPNSVRSFLEIA